MYGHADKVLIILSKSISGQDLTCHSLCGLVVMELVCVYTWHVVVCIGDNMTGQAESHAYSWLSPPPPRTRVYILVWYILCPPPPRTRVYILVRYILLQMAWRWQTLPFFRPDHVQLVRPRLAETSASCPPDLFRKLVANNLVPDEQTARDGNCGIDAFA